MKKPLLLSSFIITAIMLSGCTQVAPQNSSTTTSQIPPTNNQPINTIQEQPGTEDSTASIEITGEGEANEAQIKTPDDTGTNDIDLYQTAIENNEPEECNQISDEDLKTKCLSAFSVGTSQNDENTTQNEVNPQQKLEEIVLSGKAEDCAQLKEEGLIKECEDTISVITYQESMRKLNEIIKSGNVEQCAEISNTEIKEKCNLFFTVQ